MLTVLMMLASSLPCGAPTRTCAVEPVASGRLPAGTMVAPRLYVVGTRAHLLRYDDVLIASPRGFRRAPIRGRSVVTSTPGAVVAYQWDSTASTLVRRVDRGRGYGKASPVTTGVDAATARLLISDQMAAAEALSRAGCAKPVASAGRWTICPFEVVHASGRRIATPRPLTVYGNETRIVAHVDRRDRLHIALRGERAMRVHVLDDGRWTTRRTEDTATDCTAPRCDAGLTHYPIQFLDAGRGVVLLLERMRSEVRKRCHDVRCVHVKCTPGQLDCLLGVRQPVCNQPGRNTIEVCEPGPPARPTRTLLVHYDSGESVAQWPVRRVVADWIAAGVADDGTVHLVHTRGRRARYERLRVRPE